MTTTRKEQIAIIGAGLVGALTAIYLKKRGYGVSIFEQRADLRNIDGDRGRSINLTLSNRGILALQEVGMDHLMTELGVPMSGRMMHNIDRGSARLPYGERGQHIISVSRSEMTRRLIDEAEKLGVNFHFEHRCRWIDVENSVITLQNPYETFSPSFDVIIGADGAFSCVRNMMQTTDRYNFSQSYLEHGYKELTIPPTPDGTFAFEPNALHIWPRESYVLVALPNNDRSFTCTLFLAFEGNPSFSMLKDEASIRGFFEQTFPDVVPHMPELMTEFIRNPVSSLVTIQCYPWVINRTMLIGDAAHAIVPFYGQGLNAGFEDSRVLNELLEKHNDEWEVVLPAFQRARKPNADAIAQLSYDNFIELRDLVADEGFLLRKKIEARLHQYFPDQWTPLYGMVTFEEQKSYTEALAVGLRQKEIMDEVMAIPGIKNNWEQLDLKMIIDKLSMHRNGHYKKGTIRMSSSLYQSLV